MQAARISHDDPRPGCHGCRLCPQAASERWLHPEAQVAQLRKPGCAAARGSSAWTHPRPPLLQSRSPAPAPRATAALLLSADHGESIASARTAMLHLQGAALTTHAPPARPNHARASVHHARSACMASESTAINRADGARSAAPRAAAARTDSICALPCSSCGALPLLRSCCVAAAWRSRLRPSLAVVGVRCVLLPT